MDAIVILQSVLIIYLWWHGQSDLEALQVRYSKELLALRQSMLNRFCPPHADTEAKIAPFVEAAKTMIAPGSHKRVQVLLAFLKEHPGTPFDLASNAIEQVLTRGD